VQGCRAPWLILSVLPWDKLQRWQIVHPFAWEGRDRSNQKNRCEACEGQRHDLSAPQVAPRKSRRLAPGDRGPQYPQKRDVGQDGDPVPPADRLIVVGQELQLEKDKQRDRAYDEAYLRDQPQQEAHYAGAHLARSGQKLHENIARQLAAQAPLHLLVSNLHPEFRIEVADLSRKQDEMQKHIGMDDEENERPEHKESEERQVHTEERQLYRALQEKIAVGYAAAGDEKIEKDKEIAEPQARAYTGGVNHCVAQRLEVLCLASEGLRSGRKWRRLARSGSQVPHHSAPPLLPCAPFHPSCHVSPGDKIRAEEWKGKDLTGAEADNSNTSESEGSWREELAASISHLHRLNKRNSLVLSCGSGRAKSRHYRPLSPTLKVGHNSPRFEKA
jgi:hypothetical protein